LVHEQARHKGSNIWPPGFNIPQESGDILLMTMCSLCQCSQIVALPIDPSEGSRLEHHAECLKNCLLVAQQRSPERVPAACPHNGWRIFVLYTASRSKPGVWSVVVRLEQMRLPTKSLNGRISIKLVRRSQESQELSKKLKQLRMLAWSNSDSFNKAELRLE
jgi:hypothetical protein